MGIFKYIHKSSMEPFFTSRIRQASSRPYGAQTGDERETRAIHRQMNNQIDSVTEKSEDSKRGYDREHLVEPL